MAKTEKKSSDKKKSKKNFGQNGVVHIKSSFNNTIVTIDGDGQNNPIDIPSLLEIYFSNQEISLVGGIRVKLKDSVVKIICVLNNHEIKITIEDKGPGFNEKNINQIFDRFYSNRPENFGKHSGLGLNIVKNIVELHGGKIEASNNRNYGARVDIFLPLCQN